MSKFRNIFFKVIIIAFVVFLAMAITAYALSKIYEKEVKEFVINKIDKHFSARIDVEKIELNFWRKFPLASLRFKNITVTDSHLPENPPILVAKNLYLQFNIQDIIQKHFILRRVDASHGKVDVVIYKGGKNNFQIGQEESADTGSFFLSVESIKLSNIVVCYENQSTSQYFEMLAKSIKLPFSVDNQGIKTGLNGDYELNVFKNQGVDIIQNVSGVIKAGFSYFNSDNKLIINDATIHANNIPLRLDGYFQLENNKIFTDIKLSTENFPIANLKTYLNDELQEIFFTNNQKGRFNLDLLLAGDLGGSVLPKINADFAVSEASLSFYDRKFILDKINLAGNFSNGKNGTPEEAQITITSINGRLNNKPLNGDIILKNLKNPLLSANLETSIDLNELKQNLELNFFKTLEGQVNTSIHFNGPIYRLTSFEQLKSANIAGDFNLINGKIQIEGQEIIHSEIQAKGHLTPLKIEFKSLTEMADNSTIRAQASITNYLDLFANQPVNPVKLISNIQANQISFDKIMKIISLEGESGSTNPAFITNIVFKVDEFSWDNISLGNASGEFQYFDNDWSIQNAKFRFNEGIIKGSINSQTIQNHTTYYSIDGNFKGIDISKTFETFHNFDQDIITNKNIFGLSSGTMQMSFIIDSKNEILNNSIKAQIDFLIENGRLVNVSQLNALSSYTRIDDFSDIKFETLSNSITIENERIIIPQMNIESNKMSLIAFGIHKFDNSYDYHLNILLSEVLGKKLRKPQDEEFGIIQDDGTGKTRIFLQITGKGEEFDVKYDRKKASAKVSQDLEVEGQELKNTLKNEFINVERDSLRKAKRKVKEIELENLKKQENGEFIIEWDESDTTNKIN